MSDFDWGQALGAIASMYNANQQSQAGRNAANAAIGGGREAIAAQLAMFDRLQQLQMPYQQAGTAALNQLVGLAGGVPAAMQQFQTDPGYQFRLGQGQRAVEQSAAARGGLNSGNTLRALTEYGQNVGSNEFGNYWNRLAGLAGVGQTAATNIGNAGVGVGQSLSPIYQSMGAARGSAYTNAANARTAALQDLMYGLGRGGG